MTTDRFTDTYSNRYTGDDDSLVFAVNAVDISTLPPDERHRRGVCSSFSPCSEPPLEHGLCAEHLARARSIFEESL